MFYVALASSETLFWTGLGVKYQSPQRSAAIFTHASHANLDKFNATSGWLVMLIDNCSYISSLCFQQITLPARENIAACILASGSFQRKAIMTYNFLSLPNRFEPRKFEKNSGGLLKYLLQQQ